MSKIILFELPKEMAEGIYPRVSLFLEEYHRQQKIASSMFDMPLHKSFDLKSMALSCYTQGLLDAIELSKEGRLSELEILTRKEQ